MHQKPVPDRDASSRSSRPGDFDTQCSQSIMWCHMGCTRHACEEKVSCAWAPPGPSCNCLPMMCPITLCASSFHGNTSVSVRIRTYSTPADHNNVYPLQCCLLPAHSTDGIQRKRQIDLLLSHAAVLRAALHQLWATAGLKGANRSLFPLSILGFMSLRGMSQWYSWPCSDYAAHRSRCQRHVGARRLKQRGLHKL